MRQSTRNKYHGRIQVASGIRTLATEVGAVLEDLKKPAQLPVAERLRKISEDFKSLAVICEHYRFGGKRLPAKLRKEQAVIYALLNEAMNTPVFQEEKIIAKVNRKKAREVAS